MRVAYVLFPFGSPAVLFEVLLLSFIGVEANTAH